MNQCCSTREGSVQLWSLYMAAELKHSERSSKNVGQVMSWRAQQMKPSLSPFCCKLFSFSSLTINLPKRPTTILCLSVLESPFPSISLFPNSLVPTHPSQKYIQIFMSSYLNSPSFLLQLLHWHSFSIMWFWPTEW